MKSFRIRLNASPRSGLITEEQSLRLYVAEGGQEVLLLARPESASIYQAEALVLKSEGWRSDDEAQEACERFRDALVFALARCRIGGDLGDRAAKGSFTDFGLAELEKRQGRRVLNDRHGSMIFDTEPTPVFVSQGMDFRVGMPVATFVAAFAAAASSDLRLSSGERLAYEFFSASFFTEYADARFLLLFMSYECLIDQAPRDATAVRIVDRLVDLVKGADDLGVADRASILGSLRWLRVESIREAGRRLAREVGSKEYDGMSGEDLFEASYDARNQLVHGHAPPPEWGDIGKLAAQLEVLVSDLICRRLPEDTAEEAGNGR